MKITGPALKDLEVFFTFFFFTPFLVHPPFYPFLFSFLLFKAVYVSSLYEARWHQLRVCVRATSSS